jgi:hypothetical protein
MTLASRPGHRKQMALMLHDVHAILDDTDSPYGQPAPRSPASRTTSPGT